MEALDALAARAVHLARVFESAVNDHGPWCMALDQEVLVAAQREFLPSGVAFRGSFPASCRISKGPAWVELYCAGQPVSGRYFDVPDEAGFEVRWEIGDATVGAS